MSKAHKLTAGLLPWQIVTVVIVLPLTLLGALALVWGFRKWNRRSNHD
jgi:hypothetical protein